jgi:uncharacterized glyoxalase superfamily protein PhnB
MASPRLTGIAAVFVVDNVERTAEWYRDHLGFTINDYVRDDHGPHDESDQNHPALGEAVFEILERDGQRLMLSRSSAPGSGVVSNRTAETMDIYIWCEAVEALFEAVKSSGDVTFVHELVHQPYGMTEFSLSDCDGRLITVGGPPQD